MDKWIGLGLFVVLWWVIALAPTALAIAVILWLLGVI